MSITMTDLERYNALFNEYLEMDDREFCGWPSTRQGFHQWADTIYCESIDEGTSHQLSDDLLFLIKFIFDDDRAPKD